MNRDFGSVSYFCRFWRSVLGVYLSSLPAFHLQLLAVDADHIPRVPHFRRHLRHYIWRYDQPNFWTDRVHVAFDVLVAQFDPDARLRHALSTLHCGKDSADTSCVQTSVRYQRNPLCGDAAKNCDPNIGAAVLAIIIAVNVG